jgi:hypothetical protein
LKFAQGELAGNSLFSQRDRPTSYANGRFGAARWLFVRLNATSIKLSYNSGDRQVIIRRSGE